MLACDFFVADTVWLTQLYVFFFIEVGCRCVHLTGCTYNPTADWAVQQATLADASPGRVPPCI